MHRVHTCSFFSKPTWSVVPAAVSTLRLNGCLAKICTSLSHLSKRNTNKSMLQFQHHCEGHLKNEVSFVCFLTLATLVEAWATAAEGAALAKLRPHL